eukprot:COSAG06_NODE_1384_length_9620_cov_216.881525_9_plen_98_part_00
MPRAAATAAAAASDSSSALALTTTGTAAASSSAAAAAAASTAIVPEASGMTPKLQNIVCTVTLGCPLDLKRITLHARNAEYNPKRCAAPATNHPSPL